jgi:hypothetical protein
MAILAIHLIVRCTPSELQDQNAPMESMMDFANIKMKISTVFFFKIVYFCSFFEELLEKYK